MVLGILLGSQGRAVAVEWRGNDGTVGEGTGRVFVRTRGVVVSEARVKVGASRHPKGNTSWERERKEVFHGS